MILTAVAPIFGLRQVVVVWRGRILHPIKPIPLGKPFMVLYMVLHRAKSRGRREVRTGLTFISALWVLPTWVWAQGASPAGGLPQSPGVPVVGVPLPDGGILQNVYLGRRNGTPSYGTLPESRELPLVLSIGTGYGWPIYEWLFLEPRNVNVRWMVIAGRYRGSEDLAIEAELGYFRLDYYGWATLSDLSVGVHLLTMFPIDDLVEWWIGGGFGVHSIMWRKREETSSWEVGEARFGVHVKSGVDINLGRHWTVFAAARGDLMFPLLPLSSFLAAYVGGRYRF